MANLELNLICRLCVKLIETDKMSPIFNNHFYENRTSLPERIKYCSSVEVAEDDGLPPQICSSCLSKLNQSFTFRNQCVLADTTLKHLKNVNFKVSELPNLLKIDFENQIISKDNENIIIENRNIDTNHFEIKNELTTDESNICKNGLNNKNNKLNELKESLNEVRENNNKLSDIVNEYSVDLPYYNNNNDCNVSKSHKRTKGIRQCKKSRTLCKKPRITKGRKNSKTEVPEIKLEPDFLEKTENLIVQPDLLSFDEIKEENLDSSFDDSSRNSMKKVAKPKSLGMRKKRMKKGDGEEKQSTYVCKYCNKVYPSEGGWRYHIHTTHNQDYQPFICDLCGQSFKVKKNLEGHKNSVHFHLKHHLCDLCGRGFATKYALKVHKIWHNDEKNFTCDICGTKFRTRGKMNTHKSIHGGPKNFMCHICSRDFRWKKDFEIHMRTHTGEKPFKCSHCGKAFASLTNMKKHEKKHVEKLALVKNSQDFQVLAETVNETLYRNDFLEFGYGTEDVTNKVDQL